MANFHDSPPLSSADAATIVSRISELDAAGLDAVITQALRKLLPEGRKDAVTPDIEFAYQEGALVLRLLSEVLMRIHTARLHRDIYMRVLRLLVPRLHAPRTLLTNMVTVRGKTSDALLLDIAVSSQAAIQSAVLLGTTNVDENLIFEPVANLFGFVSAVVELLPRDERIVGGMYKFVQPGPGYLPSLGVYKGALCRKKPTAVAASRVGLSQLHGSSSRNRFSLA